MYVVRRRTDLGTDLSESLSALKEKLIDTPRVIVYCRTLMIYADLFSHFSYEVTTTLLLHLTLTFHITLFKLSCFFLNSMYSPLRDTMSFIHNNSYNSLKIIWSFKGSSPLGNEKCFRCTDFSVAIISLGTDADEVITEAFFTLTYQQRMLQCQESQSFSLATAIIDTRIYTTESRI